MIPVFWLNVFPNNFLWIANSFPMLTISFLILTLSLGKGSFSEMEILKSEVHKVLVMQENFKVFYCFLLPATVPLILRELAARSFNLL